MIKLGHLGKCWKLALLKESEQKDEQEETDICDSTGFVIKPLKSSESESLLIRSPQIFLL